MKKTLTFLVVLGILAAAFPAVSAGLASFRHRQVEIAVDMGDVQVLARDAGLTTAEMLERLRGLGATAVGLREASVSRYRQEGSLTVIQGGELLNTYRLTGQAPPSFEAWLKQGEVRGEAVYLFTGDRALAERLAAKARVKLGKPVRQDLSREPFLVEIMDDINRVAALRIGLDERDVALAQSLGLRVVGRPDNPFARSEQAVRETLAEFLALPPGLLSAVVFEGTEVTGFPGLLEVTAALLDNAGVPFGIVEIFAPQAGTARLAALTGGRAVLVHANAPGGNAQSMVNAVYERRARLLYVRFALADPEVLQKGPELLAGVAAELARRGYRGGPAFPAPYAPAPAALLFVVALGVIAAAGLLFVEVTGREDRLLWLVLAGLFLGLLTAAALLPGYLVRQWAAVAAAVVFAALAVVTQQLNRTPSCAQPPGAALAFALAAVLRTFLVVAAGGLVVFGLTATPYFYSGAAPFRGVKLVHTLPLVIIGVTVVTRFAGGRQPWTLPWFARLWRRLLSQPVLVGYLLLLVALAVLAVTYVGRTGHTAGLPVPALELSLRRLLGDFLLVRPRFKEFLFGYPLAVLGLALLARGKGGPLPAALVILGAVAPVSMVNTFMHFTAPLHVMAIRSLNGLWLGALFGAALFGAVSLAACLAKKAVAP